MQPSRRWEQPVQATREDPVCRMRVSDDAVHQYEYAGIRYVFCSADCLSKFKALPDQYLESAERSEGESLTDPVCGMTVSPDAPRSHEYRGVVYRFCCDGCLSKFTQYPDHYLREKETKHSACRSHDQVADAARPRSEAAGYFCPMCPEVTANDPGSCPSCGMALEAVSPAVPQPRTEYVCPMHPEIVRDEPGACPICGMALEPRAVQIKEDTSELDDMTRRFWVSAVLAIAVFASAMAAEFWPDAVAEIVHPRLRQWI